MIDHRPVTFVETRPGIVLMQADPSVRCGQHFGIKLTKLVGEPVGLPPVRHDGDQPQVGQMLFQRKHRQRSPQVETRSHAAEIGIVILIAEM